MLVGACRGKGPRGARLPRIETHDSEGRRPRTAKARGNKRRANRHEQVLKTGIFDAKSFASNFEDMIFDIQKMRIKK